MKLDGGQVIDDGIVARAAQASDVAVVYVKRNTGAEEMDRILQKGDWYLNPSEEILLEQVTDKFDKVVVILSTLGPIDMTWVKEYNIDSVLISYGSGSQNGFVMAEIVYGLLNPSGKLADTVTETYEEHPTADDWGYTSYTDKGLNSEYAVFGSDDPVSLYVEGIFEGHRYFDTFGKDVLYPFGSGLSYSDFEFSNMSVTANAASKSLTVNARVSNVTANSDLPAGKEVMEIYVSAPEGKLEQPYQKLVNYKKTDELKKGEGQNLSVEIPMYDFASYDENQAAYILESGYYYIRVGGSSRDTQIAGAFYIEEEILVEQLNNQLEMEDIHVDAYEEERYSSTDKSPIAYNGEADEMEAAKNQAVEIDVTYIDQKLEAPEVQEYQAEELPANSPVYTFDAVMDGFISLEQFVSQLTEEELIMILSGGTGAGTETYYSDDASIRIDNVHTKINYATSGAGFSRTVRRLNIPSLLYADGSSGIVYSAVPGVRDKNVGWPRAAAIACCWNQELLEEWGEAMGEEMVDINVDILLAPSINLHRNPMNGRHNEYYSEDPVLSGFTASAVAKGVASKGVTVCLKHYAGNDQEYYRRGIQNETTRIRNTSLDAINIITSERAMREVTLRPFEMAVKTGSVMNVMSAFNKVNGQYAAASEDLLINILRGEWGFEGFVVTDWGNLDTIADADQEMANGNDVIMSGSHQLYVIPEVIREGVSGGTVTLHQLQRNAYNLLNTIKSIPLAADKNYHSHGGEMAILTDSLPEGKVNREYSVVKVNPFIAGGVQGNTYHYEIDSSSEDLLPQGIQLLPNGTLKGKPAAGSEGEYTVTVKLIDDITGESITKELDLVIAGELEIQPEELPVVKAGEDYYVELSAFDADNAQAENIVYSTQDDMPSGIQLTEDGIIQGTSAEEEAKTFHVDISANGADKSGKVSYQMHAIEKDLTIALDGLGIAKIGEYYNLPMEAEGGMAPYTWKVMGLPEGFELNAGAIKSGIDYFGFIFIPSPVSDSTPQGIYDIIIEVEDAIGQIVQVELPLQVGEEAGEFSIITSALPQGRANQTYETVKFTTINETGEVTYSLADESDNLPSGLELAADGTLMGTPASDASGLYTIVIKATDGEQEAVRTYTLYIAGILNVDPAPFSVFTASEGEGYTQKLQAQDGPYSQDYTYELHAGSDALPAGLTLDTENYTGYIKGTPEDGTAGTYNLLIVLDTEAFAGNPVTTVVPYTLIIEEKGTEPKDKYSITVSADEDAVVEIDNLFAAEGDEVSFKVSSSDENKEIYRVTLYNADKTWANVLASDNGMYTFTMPAESVIIKVDVKEIEGAYKENLRYIISIADSYIASGAVDKIAEAAAAEFYTAYNHTLKVMGSDSASQTEVDSAAAGLLSTFQYLELRADKEMLRKLIDLAQSILENANAYIPNSITGLEDVLKAAITVEADSKALNTEINQAVIKLIEAIDKARLKPDKSALQNMILTAESIEKEKYTEASVAILMSALEQAYSVMTDENADGDAVNYALADLQDAYQKLVPSEGDPKPGETGDEDTKSSESDEESEDTKSTEDSDDTNSSDDTNDTNDTKDTGDQGDTNEPSESSNENGKTSGGKDGKGSVKTGDEISLILIYILLGASLAALLLVRKLKKL